MAASRLGRPVKKTIRGKKMAGKRKARAAGEGTIFQRKDGRWVARLAYWEDGKRKHKSRYAATQAGARKELTALQNAADSGAPMPSDRLTFEQYLNSWLDGKEAYMRPEAFRKYKSNAKNHLIPALGRIALSKLTATQIKAAYGTFRKKGLAGTTLQHIHGLLHVALEDAMKEDKVVRNVADLVEVPQRSTPEMNVLNREDADSLVTAAQGDKLEALYVLALTSGLREGELLGLRWKHVDLHRGRITVAATLQGAVPRPKPGVELAEDAPKPGTPILGDPKTDKSKRTVAIPQMTVDLLSDHRIRQLRQREEAGTRWQEHGLVFTNDKGHPIDARNLRKRSFPALLERASLAPIRFHDLRHTCATLLMAAGVPVKAISEMLGHSDITTTLRIYAHVLPEMHEQAAMVMDGLFRKPRFEPA
jgi:integrase